MTKKRPNIPNLSIYDALIERFPDVPRKGANNPYTSLNGNMFSFITKEGNIALRVLKEDQEQYWKKYGKHPVISYGAVMKEYIEVSGKLLHNDVELDKLFSMSYHYAKSLKPKPTKKKKVK